MTAREEQWNKLYCALLSALARHGQNADDSKDASTEKIGDYWIVDDDWGGFDQKLCIIDSQFPISAAVKTIGELLATQFPNWRVFVVFEDNSQREGLLVYADRIEPQSEFHDP